MNATLTDNYLAAQAAQRAALTAAVNARVTDSVDLPRELEYLGRITKRLLLARAAVEHAART